MKAEALAGKVAAEECQIEICEILINSGADPQQDHHTRG